MHYNGFYLFGKLACIYCVKLLSWRNPWILMRLMILERTGLFRTSHIILNMWIFSKHLNKLFFHARICYWIICWLTLNLIEKILFTFRSFFSSPWITVCFSKSYIIAVNLFCWLMCRLMFHIVHCTVLSPNASNCLGINIKKQAVRLTEI